MDIKSKQANLIYLSCIILSELDKLDKLIHLLQPALSSQSQYRAIMALKDKWAKEFLSCSE